MIDRMSGPPCDCHGVERYWETDRRKKQGGSWRCRIKKRERDRRYEQTAKAIRRHIEWGKRLGSETLLQEDRLEERAAYEASGSTLPYWQWLRDERPLPAFLPIAALEVGAAGPGEKCSARP